MFIKSAVGTTPVDPDEMEGLMPLHITTQEELNEWEQSNIVDAQLWLSSRHLTARQMLTLNFIKKLHKEMFNRTWRWAGVFRKTNKNIGVDWHTISVQLHQLFDDVNFQLENESYLIDEIAVRFHHRLVFIHPFANGNGRFSRLITDMFLLANGREKFSWGGASISGDKIRVMYIKALRAADIYDYRLLLEFVRG